MKRKEKKKLKRWSKKTDVNKGQGYEDVKVLVNRDYRGLISTGELKTIQEEDKWQKCVRRRLFLLKKTKVRKNTPLAESSKISKSCLNNIKK